MSKVQIITNDIKVPNKDLETLRINFPHCFDKEGNFQLVKFKNNLTEKEINFSTESYGLDWLGKSYARLLASDPATTLLKADEAHNSKPENANSENLLIKGDNLEVLKHLANAYYEQVKMIYIDPPYNTGSDGFVYEDDRKFTVKELQNLIGVDAEKAKRILDFTQQKSNSHSAWLTFLYPRLYIAKQLLKDEGVIFVSIDDNEVAQLKILMDEIYGEENFVIQFTREAIKGGSQSKFVRETHDFILVYAKKISDLEFVGFEKDELELNLTDTKGNYAKGRELNKWGAGSRREDSPGMWFSIKGPNGEDVYPIRNDGSEGRWRLGKVKMKKLVEDGDVIFEKRENGTYIAYEKLRGNKSKYTQFISILKDKYINAKGTEELKNLFKQERAIFDFSKPSILIKDLLILSDTQDGDIILDYFAGSGTTGDAVMQLNFEDSGNRKFILVQIPELIDSKKNKLAYDFVKDELKAEPTIFEITKERLKRAAIKIQEENVDTPAKSEKIKCEGINEEHCPACKGEHLIKTEERKAIDLDFLDLGFKIFETTPIWEDYNFEAEQFDSSQTLFDVGKLSEDDIKALLITWKTYDGIPLTQDLESFDLGGYTAFYGNGKLYLLHKNFTTENLKAVLEKIDTNKTFNPTSIIAFGYHFESKNLRELSENVKQYANKKKIDIDFITRY
ncbi:MAG: site-specific DNA-methyltransferase [Flavobacteriales bacterium]